MTTDADHDAATTRQMQAAPHGALYVWRNGSLHHPMALATTLGRNDLRIVAPEHFAGGHGDTIQQRIVIDHGAQNALLRERRAFRLWNAIFDAWVRNEERAARLGAGSVGIAKLTSDRDAAFAAWKAAPERTKAERAEKARLADALTVASKALQAAKRAAEEAAQDGQPTASERLSAWVGEHGDRAISRQAQAIRDEKRHGAVIRRAYAWPRCGEGFPASDAEAQAQAWAIERYTSLDNALEAMEIFS